MVPRWLSSLIIKNTNSFIFNLHTKTKVIYHQPGPYNTFIYFCTPGLVHQDNCTSCVGGMACDETGLTYPKRECSAGYFCISGAESQTPTQGANADVCPTGSYCPQGTADPAPCPQGTFNPTLQLHAENQCSNCTAGNYCNSTGKRFWQIFFIHIIVTYIILINTI